MDTTGWVIVIVIVLLLVAAALAYAAWQRRRSASLQSRFGSEYDHTVETSGGRRPGEAELQQRVRDHDSLELRSLPPRSRRTRASGPTSSSSSSTIPNGRSSVRTTWPGG